MAVNLDSRPGVHPVHPLTPPQDALDHGRAILKDGTAATLRVVRPSDQPALAAFLAKLSAESVAMRFLSAFPPRGAADEWSSEDDPARALSLIVTRSGASGEEVLAIGSYAWIEPGVAEVAFTVLDRVQGRGLGTLLLERLAQIAVQHGFGRFLAVCHPANASMLRLFRDAGFPARESFTDGAVHVQIELAPDARTVARLDRRDHDATVASLAAVFAPRGIAVVGASRDASALGHRLLERILDGGFTGQVYPVNPHAAEVLGRRAWPSLASVPGPIDLAVICTPRDAVIGAVDEAGRAGARAVVVITAGFAETGPEGAALQARLLQVVRGHGMRMVGPNCLGVVNTDPAVSLDATFAPVRAVPGAVALGSQSGALGLAVLAQTAVQGLGVSTFVSVGNKADVSGNDLLLHWESDPRTRVILLYLESLGNPRRFAHIARRVSRVKPIVCVKSGRSDAGRRAAGSHTAAIAGRESAVDALFAQTGVLRAGTIEEMFELAACFASQPLPAGPRVAIVTNAGGPGILCADACEAGGLELAVLAEATRASLAALLPAAASVANPVDMIASASEAEYRAALELVMHDPGVDAVVFVHVPVAAGDGERVRAAVAAAVGAARAAGNAKPVLGCSLNAGQPEPPIAAGGEQIPVFAFPEQPARALAGARTYAVWRAREPGSTLDFEDLDVARARAVCRAALDRGGDEVWLSPPEVQAVLDAFGIASCASRVVLDVEAAVEAAQFTGYPVALKAVARGLIHKSDVGGVELGVRDEEGLREAWARLQGAVARAGLTERLEGVLVQRMADPGVEVIAGISHDPVFGPVLAFGLGGVHVEVLRDACFRVGPLTDRDAADMVRGLRGSRLLEGYRGHPAADLAALEEMLLRLSRLAESLPVAELDLNPVVALPAGRGVAVVDARIRLARGGA